MPHPRIASTKRYHADSRILLTSEWVTASWSACNLLPDLLPEISGDVFVGGGGKSARLET
jgi:hypothetical protein